MDIQKAYYNCKESYFSKRYLNIKEFYNYLDINFPNKIEIGKSTEGNPIYLIRVGNGSKKVLIWSQMHGNETTGTFAMFDLLNIVKENSNEEAVKRILDEYEIHFIPVLNPDGAIEWDRRNALGVDINRDFNAEQSTEIKVLKQQFTNVNYDLCLNLHDQRTIFSSGYSENPATLSFLSPSIDLERSLNEVRKKSMGVISYMNDCLQMYIGGKIGRYTDEFYPNSTGDNFQKLGVPTVLFEAGHFPNDYQRQKTREYFCYALYFALDFASKNEDLTVNYKKYFDIPENKELFLDVIIRDCPFLINKAIHKVDVGIQYKEEVNKSKTDLKFVPIVKEIGDLSKRKSWKDIDGNLIRPIENKIKLEDVFNTLII